MILGLSTGAFTALHVAISLAAIGAGVIVLAQMLADRISGALTGIFLALSLLTDATGYIFPSTVFGPPQIVGVISLIALLVALVALHVGKLAGPWRAAYVVTAVLALYLNVFVGVVQAFDKLAPLHRLAPKGTEPPFLIAQAVTLAIFIALGALALRRFRTAGPA